MDLSIKILVFFLIIHLLTGLTVKVEEVIVKVAKADAADLMAKVAEGLTERAGAADVADAAQEEEGVADVAVQADPTDVESENSIARAAWSLPE